MKELTPIDPTLVIFGQPDGALMQRISDQRAWGWVVDNGRARDPIFTLYENFARADGFIALPNANPVHLLTLLAEAEVGHPLIVRCPGEVTANFNPKPIVFLGTPADWAPFHRMFSELQRQGLLRDGFDRLVTYQADPGEALQILREQIPLELDATRVNYYLHATKQPDLEISLRQGARAESPRTVAFFGSASTKNTAHLVRADQVAEMCARNGINILHGGGSHGVMGELSAGAARYGCFVKGVTVHSSGAPKIYFERAGGDAHPTEIDLHIASKDMLHRIETYAGHSEAFACLDGGIGSIQELLVIAELRAAGHPVTKYLGQNGSWHQKPLFILNESGIYTPVIRYLEERGMHRLVAQMVVVNSVSELEEGLAEHFGRCPPRPRPLGERQHFRGEYPLTPRLSSLNGAPEPRERPQDRDLHP